MRKLRKLLRAIVLLSLLALVVFTLTNVLFLRPGVKGLESLEKLTRSKEIVLTISPRAYVSKVVVRAVQEDREVVLFEGELPPKTNDVRFTVEPRRLGLRDGDAKIEVELKRLLFLKTSFEIKAKVDTTPPQLNLLYAPYMVPQGGSGGVKVRLSEPAQVHLEVGGRRFRSYQVGDRTYLVLFGVPINTPPNEVIKVVAVDDVGNETVFPLGTRIKASNFKTISIELSGMEEVLTSKLQSILGVREENKDFISLFKKVNEEVRREDEERIRRVGSASEPRRFWSGPFLQLSNSKVVSLYGEHRRYTYKGRLISESYHMGYDLASVKNASVAAANAGKVVFAGNLGIYGNTVIIDHGYGLMSLYAHLAELKVREGDVVGKGQVIGYTDTTGFAFGDHLHFGILVDGYEVSPIEWLDGNWIRTRIDPLFSE